MRLMVALDLQTEGHHWLLEQASRVASMCNGTLDLIYIQTDATLEATKVDSFVQRLQEMSLLIDPDCRGDVKVVSGPLIETLTTLSRTYEGLVVGPREPGALERILVGTIATRLMRAAECPVIIPRHTGEKERKTPKLVVGVDLTTVSYEWLIQQGGHWAAALGGVLDVVYMVPSPAVVGIRNSYVREAALKEWEAAQVPMRIKMEQAMNSIPLAHRGDARVIAGDPENDLVRLSSNYDFVVVGNREHSGLKGYLLGTVASHVVRSAQCDVITLPAEAYLTQLGAE